jgi:hypothetical protein
MAFAQKEKMDLPPYFDSQAQAAAMLGISVYDVKSAKAAGCPAFRGGGRIRTKEFQTWLKEKRAPSNAYFSDLDDGPCVNWPDRSDRRTPLFELMDFLECALCEKQITVEEYCAIGDKTIPLVIKLSRVWDAGIDERGYKAVWRYNKKYFRRKAEKAPE